MGLWTVGGNSIGQYSGVGQSRQCKQLCQHGDQTIFDLEISTEIDTVVIHTLIVDLEQTFGDIYSHTVLKLIE